MPETVDRRNSEWNPSNILECSAPVTVRILEAQADANDYKMQIEQANNAQVGLANMQTQFAALDSEFQIICGALGIFANTWAYVCNDLFRSLFLVLR